MDWTKNWSAGIKLHNCDNFINIRVWPGHLIKWDKILFYSFVKKK